MRFIARLPIVRRLTAHRAPVLVLMVAALFALAACDSGPSGDDLRRDLTAQLENEVAPGLLSIEQLTPVQESTFASFDRERRRVRFTADLKLKRDHDFGAWDQLNALALLQALGVRAEGAQGIKHDGNRTGDVIHVTGASIYVHDKSQWKFMGGDVRIDPPPPVTRTIVLKAFWRLTKATARALGYSSQTTAVCDQLVATAAHFARLESALAIASGPAGSSTWNIAEAARKSREGTGAEVINLATHDSIESLRLLQEGNATAAIIRADDAVLASTGTGPFEDVGSFPALRSLGSLFAEPLQIIVMAPSPIASMLDLADKRIAVAATGPAAMTEAVDVLRAHRVSISSLAAPPEPLALDAALNALEKGEVDAVMATTVAAAPELRAFAAEHSVRFLPLDSDAIALMTAGSSSYLAVTVPARTYAQQTRPIATVAVTMELVTMAGVSSAEIDALMKLVFREVDYLHFGSSLGALIDPRRALSGMTLTLHPAADAFLTAARPNNPSNSNAK